MNHDAFFVLQCCNSILIHVKETNLVIYRYYEMRKRNVLIAGLKA